MYRKAFIIKRVRDLQPGQQIDVDDYELAACMSPYEHNGEIFMPADQVLENIVGSAYEYGYRYNDHKRSVTFFRLTEPHAMESGNRSYISPDHQGLRSRRCELAD